MQNSNPQSQRQTDKLPEFDRYIEDLARALGYSDLQIPGLRDSFQNFNRQDKYKLIQNTETVVQSLLDVDLKLSSLPNGILQPYMNEIGENWTAMNDQLAQLQILSLIQKKEDCQAVIKELLGILNTKIKTVNDVLRANLGQSSNPSQQPQQPQQPQQQENSQGGVARQNFQGLVNRFNPASRFQAAASNPALRSQAANEVQERLAQSGQSGLPGLDNVRRQGGGSNDDVYMNKYLKYKNKYLSLKKNSI
jgi:hypothetical protein